MINPLWLRVFTDVGSDRYLSHAELPPEAARARAVWEVYDRLFGRFTGAGLDPLFHRFHHPMLTLASPVFPRGVPLLIVGTGPSLDGGAEDLRRVRGRVLVATSLRGAVALQARGLHADLVLVEHQTLFDAQTTSDEQRQLGLVRLHPDTVVLAEPSTPPGLLAQYQAARVHIAPSLPTWGLWGTTLVALALEADVPAVGLLGIDLGSSGQLDPQHRPIAALLELLAYASGACRDCGQFGAHKPGWPRATLTGFAENATQPVRRIEWRDERSTGELIDRARHDLGVIDPILADARTALELALQARAGNMPATDRDLHGPVEMMLAWGADSHLRSTMQRALGLSFLPRFWRTGVRMATPSRLWRPLVLALHELTFQADRLKVAINRAAAESESVSMSDSMSIAGTLGGGAGAGAVAGAGGTGVDSGSFDALGGANGANGANGAGAGGSGAGAEGSGASAAERARRRMEAEPPRPTRVSVLLPVKNGLPFLHEAIASLVAQTHPDLEILVIDDGSTDGGPQEVIAQAMSHVRVIKSNGQGVAAALNAGLRAATGAFIARQDADDWSHPDRLARQFEYLTQHPEIDVLATCAEFVDREGRPVETSWTNSVRREQDTAQTPDALAQLLPTLSPTLLTSGAALVHGSVMARRDALREAGGYRSQAVYAEDYDLWLRLLPRARFAKLPVRLYTYRLHDVTVSQQYRDIQLRSSIRAKLEYLQRRFSHLATAAGARMVLAGETRDAGAYREIAQDMKLTVLPQSLPSSPQPVTEEALSATLADADVVAVIDPEMMVAWTDRMVTISGFVREGNFFIKAPRT